MGATSAYVLGAIISACVGCFMYWLSQNNSEKQVDKYRFVDAVLLLRKYLPYALVGAVVGLLIVLAL